MKNLIETDQSGIWKHFSALNAVPRASKKEEKVIQFIIDFGNALNLETIRDAAGNVIIKKPATKSASNKTIILQAHLDMVHQKNKDTIFDFDTQGIDMYIDGDWVRANGTTLGADNGLGVAAIMSVLSSTNLSHPNIEALFTIDEETGMTGAKELAKDILTGEILLNLDTEEDDEFTIGCAGGIDVTAQKSYHTENNPYKNNYSITVNGLSGGHSGMEIHKGLGNANKIMNRILHHLQSAHKIGIASIDGGGLRNAIPRESTTIFATDEDITPTFNSIKEQIIAEYIAIEPKIAISLNNYTDAINTIMPEVEQKQLLACIYTLHNGVYRMSPSFAGLVEASNNLARVSIKNGNIEILCLTRSSVTSSKYDVVNTMKAAFELMGAEITVNGDYPGWTPNPNSNILNTMVGVYQELFGDKPDVSACHAGLECGLLLEKYPHIDMISFGPTILGAHSPDERASISSTNKFWTLLSTTLSKL